MEPNLAGNICVRSSIKLLHLVPFGQQTWPLLLKIEHMVKLNVFGNNSKTEKIFLNSSQSETRIALGGHICWWNGTKWRNLIEDIT
jgi:hypothetical protein